MKYDLTMANPELDGSNFDIQSVSRVGQIFGLYGPLTTELTAADVAERVGLNRTTAYRYCTSLVAAGILERGLRRGTFVLGGRILELGIQSLGRRRVVDLAPPFLRELSSSVGLTAVLSLWGARGPVVALVQEDSARTVMVTVRPGTQLDIFSAQIRVFLAYLTDRQAADAVLAELDPAQKSELEAAIYGVRRSGSCFASLPDGFFSLAAPVFDESGIAATVAVLGGDQLADPSSRADVLARVTDTAAALSDELGGREGAPIAELR